MGREARGSVPRPVRPDSVLQVGLLDSSKKGLATNLGTPRDTSAWFKNILHRAFILRGKRETHHNCTACGAHNEDWDHFWRCDKFQPTWKRFIKVAKDLSEGGNEHEYAAQMTYLGLKKTRFP